MAFICTKNHDPIAPGKTGCEIAFLIEVDVRMGHRKVEKGNAIGVSFACLIGKSYDFVVYRVCSRIFSGPNPPQNEVRHRR
jgi:hypothetical protein